MYSPDIFADVASAIRKLPADIADLAAATVFTYAYEVPTDEDPAISFANVREELSEVMSAYNEYQTLADPMEIQVKCSKIWTHRAEAMMLPFHAPGPLDEFMHRLETKLKGEEEIIVRSACGELTKIVSRLQAIKSRTATYA